MRLRAALCAFLVSAPIALPSMSSVAHAQGADDATTRAARARFEEGVRFFDKADFENARAAFLQAYVLKKHPAVLLNLALSCQKGSHPLEASKYFQQFLRESSQLSDSKRAEAERGLADVRTKLGRIEIVAAPGSEVFVGGERVGNAPLKDLVDVDPGSHVVSAKSPEGITTEQKVATAAGQKVTVKLGEAGRAAEPPVVVPGNVKAEPPKAEPPKAEPPKDTVEPPATDGPKKKSLLSPPDNMLPVYIGLGVGGVGLIGTIAFAASKGSAQSSADNAEAQIRQKRAEDGVADPKGTCVNPPARYVNACATLKDNLDKVDTNATLANVSAVIMVVGFVGAGAFYLFGPKTNANSEATKPPGAKRLPSFKVSSVDGWLSGESRGIVLRGSF